LKLIKFENRDNIAVLTLDNGKTNPISPDLAEEFSTILSEIRNEAEGMVLCGNSKFFSIGLDLPALIKLDRSEMSNFLSTFNSLVFDLYTIPIPSACAIAGHAVAGGNVLALTSDFRFATTEEKKIGLNEIKLGVPVPYLPDMILRQIVGDRAATLLIFSGEFISLSLAKTIGLIDEMYLPEILIERTVEKVAQLASLESQAFSVLKSNRVEEIKNRYGKNHQIKDELFLDCWFSGPVQEIIGDAAAKF